MESSMQGRASRLRPDDDVCLAWNRARYNCYLSLLPQRLNPHLSLSQGIGSQIYGKIVILSLLGAFLGARQENLGHIPCTCRKATLGSVSYHHLGPIIRESFEILRILIMIDNAEPESFTLLQIPPGCIARIDLGNR